VSWQLSSLKPGQLWQMPLLIFSLVLFGYAAYLFIDPKPGPTVDDRIAEARSYLRQERYDAVYPILNDVLKSTSTLSKQKQGTIHLLIATALEGDMIAQNNSLPVNHENIIQQTKLAQEQEIEIGADGFRRMAASYEALGKRKEALTAYRRALAMDVDRQLSLHRKVIDLLLDEQNTEAADRELTAYLGVKDLANVERSWALGLQGQLLIDQNKFAEARLLLDRASKLAIGSDNSHQGELAFRYGYAAWKLNDLEEADRQFRLARQLMTPSNPLDADAALNLAKVAQARGDLDQAQAFLRDVITTHPAHRAAIEAQLTRGAFRISAGQDDAGLSDLQRVTEVILKRESLDILRDELRDTLLEAEATLTSRSNYAGSLEVLDLETRLTPKPDTAFFGRLAVALEKRSAQVVALAKPNDAAEVARRRQESVELLTRAGKSYVKLSQMLTVASDEGYAENLWKGIDCFDRAGNTLDAIASLELFIAERPDDAQTPDALLRVGRSYEAIGQVDKAIAAYQQNMFRYASSLAATKSAVPLAQAYMRQGPSSFDRAERVLMEVVTNNPRLTPESNEFRSAILELGRLHYLSGDYDRAIARMEEYAQRYGVGAEKTQLSFQMADSYWKSAAKLDEQARQIEAGTFDSKGGPIPDRMTVIMERRTRLEKALTQYATAIEAVQSKTQQTDLEKLYGRLAHFYRADCLYELGRYRESIEQFDRAAMLYPNDPSAISAYMKIFTAYVQLGEPDLAKAAHARASVMLSRMPRDAFNDSTYVISREDRERFLNFASEAGLVR
jgi:tetratricopeptide (TPR) repeat protein